jgi:hypothetical protein
MAESMLDAAIPVPDGSENNNQGIVLRRELEGSCLRLGIRLRGNMISFYLLMSYQ